MTEDVDGVGLLRQRLHDADVMMRYDYAWKHSEFGTKVDRLVGVCLRFLYLAGTWLGGTTSDDGAKLRVACHSLTPTAALTNAVETASGHMRFQFVCDGEHDDSKPPHVTFCFIGPSVMGKLHDTLAATTAFTWNSSGVYFFLVGDAACLPPPSSDEDERVRGLSAFGLGRELQATMSGRGFHAAAHYVCEFKDPPNTDTLSDVMDQFNVPLSNLMVHTEKWEVYVPGTTSSPSAKWEVDIEDNTYWQQYAKGKACDSCHQHNAKLLRCVRCQAAFYCSRECQKAAWKLHKGDCAPPCFIK
ncbi:hypothetical protein H310_00353 [Aphanomyces invadans]|uniref:MYND-type domain-containing protein n=1 Tax=Aphanomyces invadans TaxID=157072 RepID=A0A024UVG6_9STRA|nr:hypothetical protein H310_00353 [Aphanomyces invadans]ETW09925.1 hypothetical protein H310_00353 [Aphanomyces invadans]|eukprot:XP_008861336.1 hypothetical protein H310_00353 [Aphanomyces invadans]